MPPMDTYDPEEYLPVESAGTIAGISPRTLRYGKGVIGGKFSDCSFGSLEPNRQDLYLEEAWQLDENGNFVQPFADTIGVWIAHDVMAYVQVFEGEDEPYEPVGRDIEAEAEAPNPPAGHGEARRVADWTSEALPAAADAADRQEDGLNR
jgi:hypothetical protein